MKAGTNFIYLLQSALMIEPAGANVERPYVEACLNYLVNNYEDDTHGLFDVRFKLDLRTLIKSLSESSERFCELANKLITQTMDSEYDVIVNGSTTYKEQPTDMMIARVRKPYNHIRDEVFRAMYYTKEASPLVLRMMLQEATADIYAMRFPYSSFVLEAIEDTSCKPATYANLYNALYIPHELEMTGEILVPKRKYLLAGLNKILNDLENNIGLFSVSDYSEVLVTYFDVSLLRTEELTALKAFIAYLDAKYDEDTLSYEINKARKVLETTV